MRIISRCCLCGLLWIGFLAGCAKITYRKVPSPVQWGSGWTTTKQKEADDMEGPRYYLPRPYLVLKTPVPVAARVAFVSFTRNTKSGRYELELPNDADWVRRILPNSISISQALKLQLALADATQQKAKASDGQTDSTTQPATQPATGGANTPAPPTSVVARVGSINKEDPVTKLGELFDVVYLPDFDEQFVIGRSFGLGKGDVQIELRNGWAAETFGEQVDRSNLVPYVINQVENASKAALNIASSWGLSSVGIPSAALPIGKSDAGQQQKGSVADDKTLDLLGNMVLLKVVEVRVAQPGLYPILKPREFQDLIRPFAAVAGTTPDQSLKLLLQTKGLAWIRPDEVFIPAPPITVVGFNVVNDAYIGPVTKDNLGLGQYTAAGPKDDKKTDGTPSAEDNIRAALIKHADAAFTAQSGLKDKLTRIGVKGEPQETKLTIDTKTTLDTTEQDKALYRGWMTLTFDIVDNATNIKNVNVTLQGNSHRIEITLGLPVATLEGKIRN